MKKIYIPVGGRLGNQLFYYSFGRWLQIKYFPKHELILDFSNVRKHGEKYSYEKSGWENSLLEFKTSKYTEYSSDYSLYREGSLLQKIYAIVCKVCKNNIITEDKIISQLSNKGIVINNKKELERVYNFDDFNKNNDIFVRSVLESSYYLNQIREELLHEISPINCRNEKNEYLYNVIDNYESICVSIRRGDYISNPDLQNRFNICDKDYFDNAIELIEKKISNPVFIFFSDDIDWCKKEFENKYDYPMYFESGDDSLSEKLNLMKSCKHFIISNSTFSWWAQWLGTNKNKIVVSPSKWFRDLESDLIEDSFIKIDVE